MTEWLATAAKMFGEAPAESIAPAPNGFAGDHDAALRQQGLNIS
jgi:hypothetical protein